MIRLFHNGRNIYTLLVAAPSRMHAWTQETEPNPNIHANQHHPTQNTNVSGRRKRIFGARAIMRYKRPDFKKAYVTLGGEGAGGSGSPAVEGGAGTAAP